ncbi:MAG: hypothetical protein NTU73_11595 [Ignavibacteriae bacterium]|nr:hypothetical protein [Ignavibacteriota bacterium]
MYKLFPQPLKATNLIRLVPTGTAIFLVFQSEANGVYGPFW